MAKTRKVLEINDGGAHLVCIKYNGEVNPFRLYRVWWDYGWHRKEITRYGDLTSIMHHATEYVRGNWSERDSQREAVRNDE